MVDRQHIGVIVETDGVRTVLHAGERGGIWVGCTVGAEAEDEVDGARGGSERSFDPRQRGLELEQIAEQKIEGDALPGAKGSCHEGSQVHALDAWMCWLFCSYVDALSACQRGEHTAIMFANVAKVSRAK